MEQMGSLGVAKKRINTFNDSCPTEISQDRRSKRRYPIELPLHYKIVKNCLTLGVGKGSTIDVSSRGIAFKSDAPLGVGSYLEVSISWPALLNESCALKLMVSGRVVRSRENVTAMSVDRYEFRTAGAKVFQPAEVQQQRLTAMLQ